MLGTVSEEIEVKVAASEAWKVYGTLLLNKIIKQHFPDLVAKIDVVQGDGGAGTILHIFYGPAVNGGEVKSYKEKITVVDDEKKVKIGEVMEGGCMELGFSMYRTKFEVIEKEGKQNECVTRTTIEYELKPEAATANASYVSSSMQLCVSIMQDVAHHLLQNHNDNSHVAA